MRRLRLFVAYCAIAAPFIAFVAFCAWLAGWQVCIEGFACVMAVFLMLYIAAWGANTLANDRNE